jgi:Spy/CpxP family protein refolding chaperone
MKTRLCLIALALAAAFGVHAQDSGAPPPDAQAMHGQHQPPDPQERAQKLAKHLQLNAEQQAQVATILQTQQQKMQALRSGGAKGQERRDQARAIMQDGDRQLQAVLSDSQRARYVAMKERAIEKRQEKQGTAEPAKPMPDSTH